MRGRGPCGPGDGGDGGATLDETSPTAAQLNRLCNVYGRTMSQLLSEIESEPVTVVRAAEHSVWEDRASGFVRRSVSPRYVGLRGELVEGRLVAGADLAYDRPPVSGLEQHIWVLDGTLRFTAQDVEHHLAAGGAATAAGGAPGVGAAGGGLRQLAIRLRSKAGSRQPEAVRPQTRTWHTAERRAVRAEPRQPLDGQEPLAASTA